VAGARQGYARLYMDVPDEPTLADFAARASQFSMFRVDADI
jgi:hypothetical protein